MFHTNSKNIILCFFPHPSKFVNFRRINVFLTKIEIICIKDNKYEFIIPVVQIFQAFIGYNFAYCNPLYTFSYYDARKTCSFASCDFVTTFTFMCIFTNWIFSCRMYYWKDCFCFIDDNFFFLKYVSYVGSSFLKITVPCKHYLGFKFSTNLEFVISCPIKFFFFTFKNFPILPKITHFLKTFTLSPSVPIF